MKLFKNKFLKAGSAALVASMLFLSSCNDDLEQIPYNPPTNPYAGLSTISDTLSSNSSDTLFTRLLKKAGLYDTLRNGNKQFTVWVPSNAAIKQFVSFASQGAVPADAPDAVVSGFISGMLPAAQAYGIAAYHISPGIVNYDTLSNAFPNVQYPTLLNPMPSVSALLRLTTFPSPRNVNSVNNIPVMAANIQTRNGLIHRIAAVNVPPQQFLWDRINTDTSLSFFKAAIRRADSASATSTAPGLLEGYLRNIGANFTVFAPTNAAFRTTLYGNFYPLVYNTIYQQAYQGALAQGADEATATAFATNYAQTNAPAQTTALTSSPDLFSNPNLFPFLTAQTVQGLAYYHVLGKRAFTNNFPTTQANFPTLLNQAIAVHPGVGLQATFTGPVVSAATVKGAANATAANILINPMPGGSSDQHYLNGTIHKIDQVLMPQ